MAAKNKKKSDKPKRSPGRPAINAPNLTKRWQIRCDPKDHAKWTALAEFQSLGDPSTLARKTLNDHYTAELAKLKPEQRELLAKRIEQLTA